MGAWVVYGLGSESQNLPGFVVLSSGVGTSGGESNFASGFSAVVLSRRDIPHWSGADCLSKVA